MPTVLAIVAIISTVISLHRLYHLHTTVSAIRRDDLSGEMVSSILSYYRMEDAGGLWKVYAAWLFAPAIGFFSCLYPDFGYIGMVGAVLCAACFVMAWILNRSLKQVRPYFDNWP